jgi:glycosyltransferase involved in cell wall biosynthesis/uncharacterized coiled-coil protein SlyX
MKRKILLITCEKPVKAGLPTTGGALRVHGLAKGLQAHGHDVLLSIPSEAVESDDSPELKKWAHEPENLAELIFNLMPDVVLLEQWGLAAYLPAMDIPLAIDLHGPLTLENTFKESGNFRTDALTKIEALSKADLLIVPGRAQRQYFLTWCLLAGADPKAPPIVTTPVSMDKPKIKRRFDQPPRIVFGGAAWPWIDPFPGLTIAGKTALEVESAQISLYVGSPALASDHPLYQINHEVFAGYEKRLGELKTVKNYGFIAHDKLLKAYASARAALDIYKPNPERDLAYSTRTVEYLRCGLPVITSDNMELAEPVRRFDAGWVVDAYDEKAIAAAVREALTDKEVAQHKSDNAKRLSDELFDHKKAVKSLALWLQNPKRREGGKSLMADFRDYYRSESVELINDAQKVVAKVNDELRTISLDYQKQLTDKERRYDELAAELRSKAAEHDGRVEKLVEQHRLQMDEYRKDIRRLQEKLENFQEAADDKIKSIETDFRDNTDDLKEEIRLLNREKEETRQKNLNEIKSVILKQESESAELRTRAAQDAQKAEERFSREVEKKEKQKENYENELKILNREKQSAVQGHAQDMKSLSTRHEKEVSDLRKKFDDSEIEHQRKLTREMEKREDLEKELQAEIKRLNLEGQAAQRKSGDDIKTLTQSFDLKLTESGHKADEEIARRDRRIEKIQGQLEDEAKEHRANVRQLNEELKRVVREREADARAMKAKEEEITELLKISQVESGEKDARMHEAMEREGAIKQQLASTEKELEARQEAADTLKSQLDELNAEIKSKFIDIDRLVSEKEAYVTAAKERFDQLEEKTTGQSRKIIDLEKNLSRTQSDLERTAGELAAVTEDAKRFQSDLDKTTRHAANLEGELGTLRRKYTLAERLLADLRQDDKIRKRLRKKHRGGKYFSRLPKLAWLWVVNIIANTYMEWWQRRKGIQIFPGMKKIENGPSPK